MSERHDTHSPHSPEKLSGLKRGINVVSGGARDVVLGLLQGIDRAVLRAINAIDTHGHDTHGHDTHGHDTHGHDTHGHDDRPRGANGNTTATKNKAAKKSSGHRS